MCQALVKPLRGSSDGPHLTSSTSAARPLLLAAHPKHFNKYFKPFVRVSKQKFELFSLITRHHTTCARSRASRLCLEMMSIVSGMMFKKSLKNRLFWVRSDHAAVLCH